MASEIEWKPNPHIWRKFQQAQTNMLKRLGMTRRGSHEGRQWNGTRTSNKGGRRVKYWSRQMLRLTNKLFGDDED